MNSRHRKASFTDEFCYSSSSLSFDYNQMHILPPVSNQGNRGICTAYAVLCAVEARYCKARKWAPTPKSMWRFSQGDLLNNLKDMTGRKHFFNLDQIILAMGARGVGLYADHETAIQDNRHSQRGVKFGLSHIDEYEIPAKFGSTVLKWKSETTEKVMKIDELLKEIANNGPVLASLRGDYDFGSWSKESASNFVYNGLHPEELSEAERMKMRRHLVAVIGFGGEDSKIYFIAQNSYGLNWGENGTFMLEPSCVDCVAVPILG